MRLIDFYCGAGGTSEGYRLAGWDVVGCDLNPQPNYPFQFVQMDALVALDVLLNGGALTFSDGSIYTLADFDGLAASPPCQAFTSLRSTQADDYASRHVDLIAPTRTRLVATGLPWIMENVPQAPLVDPLLLCGSMFDLPVKRHRHFESDVELSAPTCNHARWRALWPDGFLVSVSRKRLESGERQPRSPVVGIYGTGGGAGKDLDTWRWAMGTPWMRTKHEVAESIPPAYTEHLGRQLLTYMQA